MPISDFDPSRLPASFYAEKIRELQDRLKVEMAVVDQTRRELRWWQDGQEFFAQPPPESDTRSAEEAGVADAVSVNGSGPGADQSTPAQRRPRVRAGILRIVEDQAATDGPRLKPKGIVDEFERRDWMPDGQFPVNNIRNQIRRLADAGHLQRFSDGTYGLPPLTDYALAAQYEMPTPDRLTLRSPDD